MANSVDIRLTATDETAGAFDSAKKRQEQYAGAVKTANKAVGDSRKSAADAGAGLDTMRRSMLGAGAAAQGFSGALKGNIGQLDNVGTSLAMMTPKLMKFGLALAAVGVAAQVGKEIAVALGWQSKAEKIEKETKAMDALARRARELADAQSELNKAKASEGMSGPAASMATAREEMDREVARQNEAVKDAERKLSEAQKKRQAVGFMDETGKKDADTAIAEAQKDLSTAQEIAAKKAEIAAIKYKQVIEDTSRALADAKENLSDLSREEENRRLDDAIKDNKLYLESVTQAFEAFKDPRLRKQAMAGIAGGAQRGKDAGLEEARQDLAALDQVRDMQRQRNDRDIRMQARQLERDRRGAENEIERAQDREAAKRKLTTREKTLLADIAAVKLKQDREADVRKAEEAAKKQREDDNHDNLRKSRIANEKIVNQLTPLLQAAGG
jgi:hypothetical protein